MIESDRLLTRCGLENMYEEPKDGYPGLNPVLREQLMGSKETYPPGTYVGFGGRPGICDIVATLDGKRHWIEVKLIWFYPSEKKHTQKNHMIDKCFIWNKPEAKRKEHSALYDVHKLATLIGHAEADVIGFLMVCYGSRTVPIDPAMIERFEREAILRSSPWKRFDMDVWRNPNNAECRIQVQYWERPTSTLGDVVSENVASLH